ncbi:2-hydroxy-3-oxopropionate reductase [Roseovarius pacificus]|uniref:2-hydroxy-3-oxopropionate reductase n=1 Tax=Roseovarius pacificus TaxID=337701 RepID=A0A1M7AH65_9RHOB|nr:NAD(P)-dependent oxidoreductase [Roseovarius pacificus]GGO53471.1 2-hydroxy-3-oxopropionate reductase [Roseovarius pacificus]SHL41955.1 2-hydroxy-3-oxopropionate reductase [Roseovarius pacificus]
MSTYDFCFIGLGTMGRPMATRLIDAGYSVIAYDPSETARTAIRKAGAAVADSATDAAAQAPVALLSLPTPNVVEQVVNGPDGLLTAEGASVIVDLSTTGPQVAKDIAQSAAAAGRTLVDCPVSGGAEGARAGTLALMLAGPSETVQALVPALKTLGNVFVVGNSAGQGQTMKVLNNLMSTAALAITSETMVLGAKSGLDPQAMLDVFNAGSGRNTTTTDKFPKHMLNRNFDFGMPIKLSAKDARLCLEEADRMGVPMPVGTAVRQMLNLTRDHLGPDVDMTEILRVIEQWAKHEVHAGT